MVPFGIVYCSMYLRKVHSRLRIRVQALCTGFGNLIYFLTFDFETLDHRILLTTYGIWPWSCTWGSLNPVEKNYDLEQSNRDCESFTLSYTVVTYISFTSCLINPVVYRYKVLSTLFSNQLDLTKKENSNYSKYLAFNQFNFASWSSYGLPTRFWRPCFQGESVIEGLCSKFTHRAGNNKGYFVKNNMVQQ